MTVKELYTALESRIPASLSCEWDMDGLMCCPEPDREVRRVLAVLDITGEVAEMAAREGYDVIIAHHPLYFCEPEMPIPNYVKRRIAVLEKGGVATMSFHTRLDALPGGVNDILAAAVGLSDAEPFGLPGEEIGRVGNVPPTRLSAFAARVKETLGADTAWVSDAGREVRRVAVLGGSGTDDIEAAIAAGADTYVSGELKYHPMVDAPEMGINLISLGHFFSEFPVVPYLAALVRELVPGAKVEVRSGNRLYFV